MKNPKSQKPNPKQTLMFNIQKLGGLEFVDCDLFGVWGLELGASEK